MYIWQRENWHEFSWDSEKIYRALAEARKAQGFLLGKADFLELDVLATSFRPVSLLRNTPTVANTVSASRELPDPEPPLPPRRLEKPLYFRGIAATKADCRLLALDSLSDFFF